MKNNEDTIKALFEQNELLNERVKHLEDVIRHSVKIMDNISHKSDVWTEKDDLLFGVYGRLKSTTNWKLWESVRFVEKIQILS